MVKVIWRDSKPSDPMYSEGYQSYSPHWGRAYLKSKRTSPNSTAGPTTAPHGSETPPTKSIKPNSPTLGEPPRRGGIGRIGAEKQRIG
jgi:hypothetical protein